MELDIKHVTIALAALVFGTAASPVLAQFGGDLVSDPPVEKATGDMDTVQLPAILDQATAIAQAEQQELEPGLAGGLDTGLALSGDLEQQVSSVGGMPLITEDLQQYPTYWPGYSNASYTRQAPPQPGSPEADMATTLGTLQGALQAGADQQNSQAHEAARLSELESEAGQAIGNLQVSETVLPTLTCPSEQTGVTRTTGPNARDNVNVPAG